MATFLPLSLRDYGLSAESGFLPSEPPVGRLADPYFEKWEELATDVPSRVKDMALFREQIEGMCVLDSSRIGAGDECSLRRAYVVLSVLGHAYVWGGGDEGVRDVLPKSIAVPWCAVSDRLGVPPVVTHASMDLWNWALIDADGPMDIENLKCHTHFTGSRSEEWFHLIPTVIEHAGAPLIHQTLDLAHTLNKAPETPTPTPPPPSPTATHHLPPSPALTDELLQYLGCLASTLRSVTSLIGRMYEGCCRFEFYFKQRPFLAGFGSSEALPDGLVYEGVSNEARTYKGASAGQSSLIQMLDVMLGVNHDDPFLSEMRDYMPARHARFLEDLQPVGEAMRALIRASEPPAPLLPSPSPSPCPSPSPSPLVDAFNECIDLLAAFRSAHMGLVYTYIIQLKRHHAAPPTPTAAPTTTTSTPNTEEATPEWVVQGGHQERSESLTDVGTGGTDLLPFLKQCKQETVEARMEGADGPPLLTAEDRSTSKGSGMTLLIVEEQDDELDRGDGDGEGEDTPTCGGSG
ncbi:unnamed protein product [Vitrella brassicaformis CCMP3155]|uniref:Indoleamine 2,3-dioxygenase n=3 Tax=Vitrella brassicaformis TaxID=1169539 RepID=A0A0G4H2T8_VITBC|nr:unnamed protein product [Vitrella brassicaformis CCMP3155]|eukprot:CEM37983.1 unnamed protein product [Vitrella brassicaformis CCMP3155]